jgi:hypothetical protein
MTAPGVANRVRNLPGPVATGTRRERIGSATGQARERVHGLPGAPVILARSMPVPAVAGHGGGPLSGVTVTGFAGLA